jgi:hypothetical protein
MTRQGKIRAVAAITAVAAASFAAAGFALSRVDNPGEPRAGLVDYAQNGRVHKPSVTGPPEQVLAALLRRTNRARVVGAALGGPPPGFTGSESPDIPVPPRLANGRWVYSTVAVPDEGPRSLRAVWEADLVAGALRDAVRARGGPEIVGSEIALRLPDGRRIPHAAGGMGDVQFQQEFENPSAVELEARIRGELGAAGFRVTNVDSVMIEQIAPVVTVSVDDPATAVERLHEIVNAAFGRPLRYEGYYLEAQDAEGGLVLIQTAAFRSGVSHRWTRPDLDPRRPELFGTPG